jgi:imidazolonepropionase-like amidohydrolase
VSRGQLTPLEAITAATSTNARALGLEAEIGTIAAGRQADLLIVDGDPTQDIGQLERPWGVLQAGRWIRRGTAAALAEE